MVSDNVWVEATIAPQYAKALALNWTSGTSTSASKMHVTLAFSTYKASKTSFSQLLTLREQLVEATQNIGHLAAVEQNGAAVFRSGYAVLLVSGEAVWKHHRLLTKVFDDQAALDQTYPGYTPHITLATNVNVYDDIAAVHRQVRNFPYDVISVDGTYLRAGRTTLPLWN